MKKGSFFPQSGPMVKLRPLRVRGSRFSQRGSCCPCGQWPPVHALTLAVTEDHKCSRLNQQLPKQFKNSSRDYDSYKEPVSMSLDWRMSQQLVLFIY